MLYKTTIVIWTQWDPSNIEIDGLAKEAMSGDAYCSHTESISVEKPENDPHWDGTEFFANLNGEIE